MAGQIVHRGAEVQLYVLGQFANVVENAIRRAGIGPYREKLLCAVGADKRVRQMQLLLVHKKGIASGLAVPWDSWRSSAWIVSPEMACDGTEPLHGRVSAMTLKLAPTD